MQWAAIFHKRDVRFRAGFDQISFYNVEQQLFGRTLPCKLRCGHCGTLIADEGRRMWLAFPTLFDFAALPEIPMAFRPSCHIFYGSRVLDVQDTLPKWAGHKNKSPLLGGS